MDNIGIASVAAITVICYLVGLCVKAVPNMADKYIPICCGVAGAALAAAGVCFFCLGGNVTLLLVALWIGAGTIPLKKSGNRACHIGWKRVQ